MINSLTVADVFSWGMGVGRGNGSGKGEWEGEGGMGGGGYCVNKTGRNKLNRLFWRSYSCASFVLRFRLFSKVHQLAVEAA